MRVLILGGRAPVALDHVRRFAAQGWSVYVGDSAPARLSSWSRSVAKAVALPPPRGDTLPAFAATLNAVIERERIDLLVPTCEEVFFVSRVRGRLPETCNVFAAPFEMLRELHSKWTFLAHARDCGVEVPDSALVQDIASARDWARGRGVVLKPEFSRFGVYVRLYPHGIPPDAPPLAQMGRWVVQAFHKGTEICSYSIAVKGRLCAHIAYRPSYRLAGSSSYYFDAVTAPRIESFVERFVARLGFTGQISFDWIDSEDGTLAVLECNPRAISGLHLFGRHDPLPAAMMGEVDTRIVLENPMPRMLAGVMLAVGLPSAIRRSTVKQWHYDWSRATDVLVVPGDKRPLLGAVADIGAFVGIALRSRCSLRAASTRDIEWDGEALVET
jgi:hypothetical protein